MEGIGTGSWEYLVMILVYLVLSITLIYFSVRKWRTEGYVEWTSFESFFCSMQLFFFGKYTFPIHEYLSELPRPYISFDDNINIDPFCVLPLATVRLCVLALLLYLRFGYLPVYEDEIMPDKPGELEAKHLDDVGKDLLVTWELLYVLGTALIFSSISLLIHKWRSMMTSDSFGHTLAIAVINGLVYIPCFALISIQYYLSRSSYMWITTTYYYVAASLIVVAFLVTSNVTRLSTSLNSDRVRNEYTLKLFKCMLNIRYSAAVIIVLCLFRAGTMTVDSIGYRYLNPGSVGQVIWNLVFKYICWIGPELLLSITISYAFLQTEEFHNMLAVIVSNGYSSEFRRKFIVQERRAQPASERVDVEVHNLSQMLAEYSPNSIPISEIEQTIREVEADIGTTKTEEQVASSSDEDEGYSIELQPRKLLGNLMPDRSPSNNEYHLIQQSEDEDQL